MFEAHVLHLLRKYLGEYVHGLSTEALRISVWKGDVVLKDLKLKAEALNSLKLPVIVDAGFVGSITLKVPWKSLGKEPVVVLIDRVFVLAHPAPDGQALKDEDREKLFEVKLQQIEEAELATLEATIRRSKVGTPPGGNSWLGSLIATIIGNLKISISNVHIRYEDSVSNPGHPFCSGISLAKLAAVTMDEQGNETFDTSGALDKLRKSLQLQRLAVYHDSESLPWKLGKKWEDLNPTEWTEIFADGIDEFVGREAVSLWALNRKYLVSPINGVLKYHRLGKQERHDPETPFEKASLVLSDVSLTISEAQYYDGIKLLEAFSRYRTRVEVSHLRPMAPVSEDHRVWWRYAVQASLQQKKMCFRFSWERIRHLCHLRRHYVHLYASSLQQLTKVDSSEIRQIEKDLDSKVIILWRLLAHARVESVKLKEAAQQKGTLKRSWWSFGWRTSSGEVCSNDSAEPRLVEEGRLTKEEWQSINNMLSYQHDEDSTSLSGKDMQTMIQFLVDVSIGQAAARIISINQTEVLCGRFEQLQVTTKLYHRSSHCDVSLRYCGLSAPEGSLAQSVSSETKANALTASFVHSPHGEKIDWRLSATIAPCHVTVLMESYERFLEFVKRSNAVSPVVALETATALQMKIEKVTRRAQEQLQMVLEEQSRFALDIDFDAPKVRIPMRNGASNLSDGHFLLDFGHFTLHTREGGPDGQRQSLYSRFYISGRDIAAFFMDGGFESENYTSTQTSNCQPFLSSTSESVDHFYSLIDRCGMSVIVDQIKLPHPRYPSTRVSVQVPNLGIHFSPKRYSRIVDLLNIFYGSKESSYKNLSGYAPTGLSPWYPADLASDARILVWRGIGNSLAEWQPCFLVLSGLHLYVLESEASKNYLRCSSMSGRHVFEVSPTSVGGSLFSLAISFRGIDTQKALESSNTLIIEFRDDKEKALWLKGLVQATYKASAPPVMDILGESSSSLSESCGPHANNSGTADLVLHGALVETKLSIYGKLDKTCENADELLILELLAGGGKINLIRSGSDLTVKMKLHSLQIKDELQGHLSLSPQYLAYSVLKHDAGVATTSSIHTGEKALDNFFLEEDEIFKDALPEFISTSDQSSYIQNPDMVFNLKPSHSDSSERFSEVGSDALNYDKDKIKGKCFTGEVFYEAQDIDSSDFVAVTFLTRNPDSSLYVGVDTQMSIHMSKLEFFCNRPTLVALIEFGLDVSLVNSGYGSSTDINNPVDGSSHDREKTEEIGRAVVKGLLGYGKGRVVFYLSMDVGSVCVYLNKEDGSQLAMFVQESFLLDLKVHPSSLTIDGTLGNFRLCDMSLGVDHCWGWLCDIRNQGIESLIKFTFQSYSIDDDDYEGHDYSLCGRLSAVRIVFLYRFVQEITSYFWELATPHTEEAIKFVDKVGGIEWLIQKYEIEGASALKLDLSLDTPIIIVPRNSISKDFMQLDLGQLQVKNSFSWHGCQEKDPSAVHLDILHAEIQGVNMAVGINGLLGKPMIREGQGVNIQVRRSLRDVFQKVPTISVEVQVGLLHCVMSDKEYNIILDCAYMNISEEPRLPTSFRSNVSVPKDSIRMLAEKVNLNSQILLSRTVAVVAVEIRYALLDLCNGLEESPLAQIALEGLWVSYRTTSLSEADLYVTIPKFSVLDIRPDTKPEMRLMLGSSSDVHKQASSNFSCSIGPCPISSTNDDSVKSVGSTTDMNDLNLTMLIMDYRFRSSSQSFVIRIQQPRILVVLDFLLPVVEFFVPALGTITGREETLNPKNDPITKIDDIILVEPIYMQSNDVEHLSPSRQLIVNCSGIDEFTYDGCGGTLCLSEEFEFKDQSSCGVQPVIVIGRGKNLRFKNVKIENASLLRKCTYLDNDSCFSVSPEDGVELSLLDTFMTDIDKVHLDHLGGGHTSTSDPNIISDTSLSQMASVSFEAQVVSPELIFYDSTKLSSDDSLHIEKLLRAKMDLSFMFAKKESDTWVRSLLKDLTIEAGSGLVVLDPVDISGGYTSVKDKTNISVVSTDVCIHLSLSVTSLLLQLQSQAAAALQFGNANALASCTSFKRLWVSQKGNVSGYNLTFWRPQAPSNYAILGDCVTSRPIPPSQVVMAVCNTYGRVRKPIGFKLIGLFSNFQAMEDGGNKSNTDSDCSLWMPLAPPGYSALGCVAHIGSLPPPNHVVYCIRSDLITSATFADCIFTVPSKPRVLSGFSIWRIDNIIGSFYAHASENSPPKLTSLDLNQILLRNPNCHLSFTNKPSSFSSIDHGHGSHQGSDFSASSSRWDILRSVSKPSSYYMSTPHFERIWYDKGCDLRRPVSIWRPLPRLGFSILGDCIIEGLEPPALGLLFKSDNSGISAEPVQFTKVAHIMRKGLDEIFFWYPIAPPGYASLGCVVTRTDEVPKKDSFCCPRMDLVHQANISEEPISRSSSSKGSNCWSIWKVENQASTFLARPDLKKPSSRLAYNICDYVKPKARENISAEIKLGCFSLTVLDSSCGMMTPLFDTTITNISLATHGRLAAMNAVLICSIAASTFNRQLESWEPLVEPFDGIFKVETYDTNEQEPERVGKRVRVAAPTTVNLNLSAANLETLTEALVSWRTQTDLEQKSTKNSEQAGQHLRMSNDTSFSALEEDDVPKVIMKNKLGCDIYIKKVEQNSETIELLQNDCEASVLLPPPRFSDRLNVIAESRETRYYIAIQIFEAKGLPTTDDGNSHEFFCALRLLTDDKFSNQHKLFPQSARTRCVKINDLDEGIAKWNELFIFEVPDKEFANLELEVTNLASKAGKGEVIGALSIPVGSGAHTLKRAASIKMLQQSSDIQKLLSYPLRRRGPLNNEDRNDRGSLLLSTAFFERNTIANLQREVDSTITTDMYIGFWVGLSPEGPWESFGSLLPLSVVPKSLDEKFFAFEVVMRNGKKHAVFRTLAVVVNDADIKLEVCTCPASILGGSIPDMTNSSAVMTEEIFENQQYQPISGWGNNSTGFSGNDPGRWSTRDLSYSSKDFFENPLPPGWRWTSAWTIDKSPFVDADGWAYGPNFQSLKWPPNSSKSSSKSALDFVRRRRWIRTRKQVAEKSIHNMRNVFAAISPGSSAVLPWSCMAMDRDLCLQVRPFAEYSQAQYTWGEMVSLTSGSNNSNGQAVTDQDLFSRQNTTKHRSFPLNGSVFKLNHLEKKDTLFHCSSSNSNKHSLWFTIGTDAAVLHTDVNLPVYDWKISINAPLKLENKLPYQAEYTIWERTVKGTSVERQHGIVSSGSSAFVYSADIRRPIYLTLFVQGGWVLEKDAVLIMDLSAVDHASSFWMIHRQSNRRLRVSIERDLGVSNAAPKTIRFFVPYWICNDSSVLLTYRIVEVEPFENAETDYSSISKAVKSAKVALKNTSKSVDRKNSGSRRNIQILEAIEDSSSTCAMLSPQDYMSRSGILPFPSRHDACLSPRVGIAVAVSPSEHYSPGISLFELDNKERVDVKAFFLNGSYYKLSALLNMASDRTKVVRFQPQTVFINRVGRSLSLQQCGTELVEWLHPTDPPKLFKWHSSPRTELLKLCLEGYKWSTPFSVDFEGVMCVSLKNNMGNKQMYLRVEVRSGTKNSRYEVIFRLGSWSSPYRIENHSMFLPVRFRQVDGTDESWQHLPPNAAASFYWEDLGRQRLLEILVDGTDPLKSGKYNIDEVMDHQPMQSSSGPMRVLRLTVLKEGKMHVAKLSDWMPDNESLPILHRRAPLLLPNSSENDCKQSPLPSDCEFHVTVELAELGLSIIDHMPEEVLYLSIQNLLLSYSTGLGSGISRFKLRMLGIQVDNQLPFTPMPVLFRPQQAGDQLDCILKFSVTMQTNGSLDLCVYPYIGFQGPENSAFLVNIHEPIIWRLHEMVQQAKLSRIYGSQTTAVSVDPIIQIGLLNVSEIRFKLSMAMSPTQRPRGVLGFWSSLMTALGNTEHMPVRINQRFHEEVCMRQTALISTAISNIQKDLLSQPLQLLSGVDILGNASSALGHMSKGVAALSMDKKFIQGRQKQESKGVEDIGDVIREGGGALAKGFFRGVTGILTKPLEGAKSSGVEGFVQGVGKGIIGAAAQPVSGVLDLLSKTTEGANAVRMKIASAITSEEQLLRRRLPRVIGGDNLLRPYDEFKATGQVILQLAESAAFFGQVDLFKVRGKFASSDAYEDHFLLPKGKILLVTHRRVLLLQQPTNIMAQKKFNPVRDPCSVLWDVLWDDLVTMELVHGKKDHPRSPPSHLILYLQTRSIESKEHSRVIKCSRDSQQAVDIYSSIEQAMSTYGPNHSKEMQKKKVRKPYAPCSNAVGPMILPKEVYGIADADMPVATPTSSTFGTVLGQPQTEQEH